MILEKWSCVEFPGRVGWDLNFSRPIMDYDYLVLGEYIKRNKNSDLPFSNGAIIDGSKKNVLFYRCYFDGFIPYAACNIGDGGSVEFVGCCFDNCRFAVKTFRSPNHKKTKVLFEQCLFKDTIQSVVVAGSDSCVQLDSCLIASWMKGPALVAEEGSIIYVFDSIFTQPFSYKKMLRDIGRNFKDALKCGRVHNLLHHPVDTLRPGCASACVSHGGKIIASNLVYPDWVRVEGLIDAPMKFSRQSMLDIARIHEDVDGLGAMKGRFGCSRMRYENGYYKLP